MLNLAKRLWREEEGQGMVEYGLILALIAIVAMVALTPLGEQVAAIFDKVTGELGREVGGENPGS